MFSKKTPFLLQQYFISSVYSEYYHFQTPTQEKKVLLLNFELDLLLYVLMPAVCRLFISQTHLF